MAGSETTTPLHEPAHRWIYYPEMTRDEVLLLKVFDSRRDGRVRCGCHCAFRDPLTLDPKGLHLNDEFCISNDEFCISNDEFCIIIKAFRESIETRCLVILPKGTNEFRPGFCVFYPFFSNLPCFFV